MQKNHKENNYYAIVIIGVLFFIFGFVSWLNSLLIPYFRMVCELNARQSMLVAFAFYFSYFVMAIPSSAILKKTGFKNGMTLGLWVMAAGALIFVPAAVHRTYGVFLCGLFVQATGLTILQTASNPYITILGPIESAAKRISVMGVCNKAAGAIAPLILLHAVTKSPDELDQLKASLPHMSSDGQTMVLDELATRLIIPYFVMAFVLAGLGLLIRRSSLPDVREEEQASDNSEAFSSSVQSAPLKTSIFQFPQLWLATVAIFFGVSAEVLTVDSIINYSEYLGYSFMEAKYFATYTLLIMIVSYLTGIWTIPRYIRQKRVLLYAGMLGLVLTLTAISVEGRTSVWFIASLGLCNALLWPSTWPLALDGLGKFTKQGSALLIMGVAGGAITPVVYGMLSDHYNPQAAYWVLVPCYVFILLFAAQAKPSSIWRRAAVPTERI